MQRLLNAICMGFIMTMIITLTVSLVNVGLKPAFLMIWLRSWLIAFLVASPLIYLLPPRVNKLTSHLLSKN